MEIRTHAALAELFRRRWNDTTPVQFIPDHEAYAVRQRYTNNKKCHREYEYKSFRFFLLHSKVAICRDYSLFVVLVGIRNRN